MSRTYKDKKEIYRHESERTPSVRLEPELKQRFLNFKKSGPPLDSDNCPDCRGLTHFQSGYLTCCECGWTEDVVERCNMEKVPA